MKLKQFNLKIMLFKEIGIGKYWIIMWCDWARLGVIENLMHAKVTLLE